jgi:hypothetical protein
MFQLSSTHISDVTAKKVRIERSEFRARETLRRLQAKRDALIRRDGERHLTQRQAFSAEAIPPKTATAAGATRSFAQFTRKGLL